jgi:hypothetical protein
MPLVSRIRILRVFMKSTTGELLADIKQAKRFVMD